MGPVSLFLLTVAAIFLVGILGEIMFERTGVPDVVWLIGVGILLGPVTGLVSRSELEGVAPYFGALTLVIVLFDGGSELRLKELSAALPRGSLLAVMGFVASVVLLAGLSMVARRLGLLPGTFTWLHGVMLGTILGGSSSVVIMPALRKAGLATSLSNVVNLESALTDVLSVVATGAVIHIIVTGSTDAGGATVTLLRSFAIGLGGGVVAGLLSLFVLRRLKRSAYAYPLILGTLLILYVLIDEAGGSAALGILAVAVLVGNAPELSKVVGLAKTASLGRTVQGVHDEITFIIKSFFFTFIGAMLGTPWPLFGLGVGLGVALLVARVPVAALGTARSGMSRPARALVGVSMPRGMAAGVLAMMPYQAGVPGTRQLPVVVFATVLTTILLFAAGFPFLRRRLPASELEAPAPPFEGRAADASMTVDRIGPLIRGADPDATAIDTHARTTAAPIPLVRSDDPD